MQDVVKREGKRLVDAICNRGVVYVCGSSGNMPRAVREAFLRAIVEFGGERLGVSVDWDHAEKMLEGMEKGGFYVQETW